MDLEGTLSGGLHAQAAAENFKVEAVGSEAKHIIDLLQAEAQGRLVVLPCKVGSYVWVTGAYGTPINPPVKAYVDWCKKYEDGVLEAGLRMSLNNGLSKVYGYTFDSFGKLVHLTREAAENTLKS